VNEANNEIVLSNSFTVVDPATAASLGLTGFNGNVGSVSLFPTNLGAFDVGTINPVTTASVLNTNPFDLTPTNLGLTPVNSTGTTPLFSTGLTPTSFNNGLTSTLGGTTPTGDVGNTFLNTSLLNSSVMNSFNATGQTTNGGLTTTGGQTTTGLGFTGLGLTPISGLTVTPTSATTTTTTTTLTF